VKSIKRTHSSKEDKMVRFDDQSAILATDINLDDTKSNAAVSKN